MVSRLGRGSSSTGATGGGGSAPSAMQPTLSRSLVQVEPPVGFARRFFRRQERLSTPNGRATAARKGERCALGSTLLLLFAPPAANETIEDPRGNFLFMRKVNLIEVKWAK